MTCRRAIINGKKKMSFDIASITRMVQENVYEPPRTFVVDMAKSLHAQEYIEPMASFKMAGSFTLGTTADFSPKSQFYIQACFLLFSSFLTNLLTFFSKRLISQRWE